MDTLKPLRQPQPMQYRKSHPWITFQLDLRNAPARFWMLLGAACSKCEQIASVPLLPDTAERLHQLYLERGVRATTAIEGNTLSEQEISKLARGELDLPPSKQYLGIEVQNILDACNDMLDEIRRGAAPTLDARRVKDLNRMTLSGLDIILSDEVAPGEIRSHESASCGTGARPRGIANTLSTECANGWTA